MIVDTLRTKHSYREPLSFEELRAIGAKLKVHSDNKVWILNPAKGDPLPRITFYFPIPTIMHLLAEVSVPRFANGHNARLLDPTENDAAIRAIADYVEERTGLDFDPMSAKVSRADFSIDIQLGEPNVYKAIERLSRLKIGGLKKRTYNDATIYFYNKSIEIRIYSKLQEVYEKKGSREAIEAARGNLRFEYCLLNAYGVSSHAKKFGLPDTTVRSLITKDVSDAIFSRLFSEIDFPNLVTDERSNLEKLIETFSTRKAIRLAGFLEMVRRFGEPFFKDPSLKFSKDSYYYSVRQCRKAGVWNTGDLLE
ncbi:MAG: phage/plasmid replication protein [Pyrinomonadaceae bacterium]